MISNIYDSYTISESWILRKDDFYHTRYTLYNINDNTLVAMSESLYCIVKILYYHALSMHQLTAMLAQYGIDFDWKDLEDFERKHTKGIFVKSNKALHSQSDEIVTENFCDGRVPVSSTPMDAEIHFTHNCNLQCRHCFQESDAHSDGRKHLSTEQWLRILKQFEMLKMQNIIISGGEPLFYDNFQEVMKVARDYHLFYTIMTNGMLLNADNLKLFNKPNIKLIISLDGHTPELHEVLRNKNTFKILEQKLKILVDNHVKFSIAHVLHKKNVDHIEAFLEYLVSMKIKEVSFGLIEPTGRAALNRELLLSKKEEQSAVDKIQVLSQQYEGLLQIDFPDLSFVEKASDYGSCDLVYCSAGTKRIAVSSDGLLYPCISAFDIEGLMIGDLKKDTIMDLWVNNELWELYRGGISIAQVKGCNDCNLNNACALRNCRIKSYTKQDGLYSKPRNCLADKMT